MSTPAIDTGQARTPIGGFQHNLRGKKLDAGFNLWDTEAALHNPKK
ncbi:hypothetical protein JQW95_10910 [Sulfitobacter pseudonitzschiae]|uniref:Uncharacterized protein n=1 Tax=Pseudosulfitobacter pseudonitzschiae TaxID=1402135 RepID=A0A9Q2NI02_9RHOB|nr:hypothetical protein [Pseudosulfitobacter pseudonitzschiae]MBM2312041.1 hypothetical protein [Pseudosulfitobacter pseudonitzschiae]MBM2326535.1 hypothetical protein [Pseudosulfitobacter pseudonitzschiae]MBM2336122.1 hypothetical protein [Pseudosulfitobacter pseudonitzschiae]MBM2355056.1 hypothetical protein [Pseudosulfitobacter pseudonitzschiae]